MHGIEQALAGSPARLPDAPDPMEYLSKPDATDDDDIASAQESRRLLVVHWRVLGAGGKKYA